MIYLKDTGSFFTADHIGFYFLFNPHAVGILNFKWGNRDYSKLAKFLGFLQIFIIWILRKNIDNMLRIFSKNFVIAI